MQQISIPPLPELFWFAITSILVSVLSGGTLLGILTLILNRNKPNAEVHETEARTAKSLAEVRSLDLQTNISAGDAVLRLVQQLTFAQVTIDQKTCEIERLSNENEAYEIQMRKAKALLKLHNIIWDEMA